MKLDMPTIGNGVSFSAFLIHSYNLTKVEEVVRYQDVSYGEFVRWKTSCRDEILVKQFETGDMVIVKSNVTRAGDIYSASSAANMEFLRMRQDEVYLATR